MNRTVVISGGGTGIGLAAAHSFARMGDRLVLVGRRRDVLERAAAELPDGVACPADLTEPAGARAVAELVRERFGTVDVLVHSAGGNSALHPRAPTALASPADVPPTGVPPADASSSHGPFPDRSDPDTRSAATAGAGPNPSEGDARDGLARIAATWTADFRTNTLSAVLLTEALRDRLASPGGRVLFVSSVAAYRGSGSAAYGAAKAALHPYAHALAAELGPRGVTVNVVAPGLVGETDFFGDHGMTEENRRARVAETLNGRAGTPGDVAETLRWLASPAAGHVTSQVVQVNGGAQRGS
ncbi:SDR family NAD(P)-dependent oxidoreductase [Streptomyces spiramenti]|uniref:SDR family oxidoreductase n=1 Tax=Streptomyces spiramenti TaxID=2720606 RepID=A0ABX1AM49_9ACTN|nr:SDR family oxidoreductase [Streptomyces spiramenti]NJP68183.1 SDR family oxidoreductase [Streptomyces spiramenti]